MTETAQKPGAEVHEGVYKALFEATVVGISLVDSERRILACNQALCRILERPLDDILGRPASDFDEPGWEGATTGPMDALVQGIIESYSVEKRYRRPDGSSVRVRITTSPISREADRYVGMVEDLTASDVVEAELREQKALLERAQEVGGVGSWVWYPNEGRNSWSPQARRIFGFTDADADGEDEELFFNAVHPDDRDAIIARTRTAFEQKAFSAADFRIIRPSDGEVRWVHGQSIVDGDRMLGAVADITEARRAQEELRRQSALLDRAQQIGGIGTWVWDAASGHTDWSSVARSIYGFSDEDAERGDSELFWRIVHADDREWLAQLSSDSLRERAPYEAEHRIVRPDGQLAWVRTRADVEQDEGGLVRQLGVVIDVTDQKQAEQNLAEQTAALERAHELARLGRFTIDVQSRTVAFSVEVARLLDAGSQEMLFGIDEFRARFIHEDDIEDWSRSAEIAYMREGSFAWESRMRRADGSVMWARIHGRTEIDESGTPVRAVGVIQDVTDRHTLEEQLLQAQKLEAVGQLAGGVAHDFNNLLTVIVGNVELALSSAEQPDGVFPADDMYEILRAADRASELVRQLLAFSRADTAQPRIVDLNAAVQGVRRMLMRLLEENIRVQATLIEADTPVLVDPGQLEQVLLNLAVNARDAMPRGGRLTIATHADTETVTLRVSDTGTGMDHHTRARIFDPFYTTKAPGEGTGLGLSTVYGIVTKAGGTIEVESAPGSGSTFIVRFPRAVGTASSKQEPRENGITWGGPERVLIVEDDEMVRDVAAQILERTGYEVVTAENGQVALDILAGGESFDLIVSDLMMPTVTGIQLATELRMRGVTIPIVYTSGYAEGVTDRPPGGPGTAFLPKPFSRDDLTAVVRRLLDGGLSES